MGASRVACASFNLGTNTTISITRDDKAYTHTLKYSFNGATGTIAEKSEQTSYVWNPPEVEFYSKIPNTTSGYGIITCETYNGNTLVGTATAGFYAYAVKSACVPSVSGTVVDTNPATIALTGNRETLVCNLSQPKCTLTTTPKNSTTISSIQIENPVGLVATTSPYTFDTVYGKEFRFKATDSRGYSTTTVLNVKKFIDYSPCYFETVPTLTRTESTSTTATATLKGYCFNGSFGSASNTLLVQYRYKAGSGSYGNYVNVAPTWNAEGTFTANVSISNLSLGETYTVEFVVSDKLTTFPVETVLGQGTGDFRIAKDHVLAKNNLYLGSKTNTEFRAVKARRVLNGKGYEANFGVGSADGGTSAIELYEDGKQVARYDLRKDGFMYNSQTFMSVAEIMSNLPSDGAGYFLLNGGDASPVLVQWGKVSITPISANVVTRQKVRFLHSFSSAPFVCSEKNAGSPAMVYSDVSDITKDGFTISLQRCESTSTSILWVAIGNGTASLPK